MYNTIIKNATVIDGSGSEEQKLDVAISGDEIAAIDKKISARAEQEIDATGLILSPGFIDIQNHSDAYWQLFDNPNLDSLLSQGITTILVGNCGASLAPLLSHNALLSIQKWHNLEGVNLNWQSFSEFIEELSKTRLGCNVASLVGYSTLRRGLLGDEVRALSPEELLTIKHSLKTSLESGAFGLSTGLSYAHEIIISELEIFELAKIVYEHQALLSLHLRSEGSEIVEALDEALDIIRHTNVNLKVSHLKIRQPQNWPKFPEVVNLIDTAFHQGLPVHFDAYPYDTTWQPLYSYLPKWAIEGGRNMMLKIFADPVQKNKILAFLNNSEIKFSKMIVASTSSRLNYTGKTIGQIAKNLEMSSEQTVLHLLINGGSEVLVFENNLDEEQIKVFCNHPLSFISTDGGGFNINTKGRLVHPRCFGAMTKYLSQVVKSESLPLPEAIYKMTHGPAKKIGLKNRGLIKAGFYADLVLFEKSKIIDLSGYQNPFQYSVGISYVFVNGKLAIKNGQITNTLSGYALRKS